MDPGASITLPPPADGRDPRTARLIQELRRVRDEAALLEEGFRRAPAPMLLISAGGTVVDANQAFAGLVGRSVDDLLAMSVADLVPGTWAERTVGVLDSLWRDAGDTWDLELLCGNGSRVAVSLAGAVLAPDRLLILARDTSRARAAEATMADLERWHFALDCAGDGAWDWNVGADECWWSDGFARLAGVAAGTLAPRLDAWLQRVHGEDADALRQALSACADGRRDRLAVDHRLERDDGTWQWVSARGAVLARDASGRALRLAGLLTDLEPVKQAEAQLAALAARQQALLRAVPELLVTVGRDNRVREIMGRTELSSHWAERLAGRSLHDLGTPEMAERMQQAILEVFASGEVRELTFQIGNDGGPRVWQARIAAVDQDEVLASVADVTKAHDLEERLRQAQKMEAMGQLAAGIAHDFNNLLSGITGYADLLRNASGDDPKRLRQVSAIIQAANRASELTGRLLAFSRKGATAAAPVDVHEAIQAALDILRRTIDPRIGIITDLVADPRMVLGDRARLQSVLLNLGVNARDAMPDGGIFTVATATVELPASGAPETLPAGRWCRITVSDTGTGMSDEVKERIFEPFFTTKTPGHGTGLGLSAVHGTVHELGGTIQVASVRGAGTTFTLWLPVVEAAPSVGSNTARLRRLRGTGTILVVEDEELLRDLVQELLSELGYQITTARDGVEAVELFRAVKGRFDLVLLDLVMPRLSGLDCLEQLKEIDPHARVVLVSGMADTSQMTRASELGVTATVPKPYNAARLAEAVREALGPR